MTTRVAVIEGSRGRDVLAGAAAMAPLVVAYAPFALVIGSTVATLDQPVAGWAGSWLIYGGSAHLAALQGLSRWERTPRRRHRAARQRAPARLQRVPGTAMARPAPLVPGRRRRPAGRPDVGAGRAARRARHVAWCPAAVLPGRRAHPRGGLVGHDRRRGHRRQPARARRSAPRGAAVPGRPRRSAPA